MKANRAYLPKKIGAAIVVAAVCASFFFFLFGCGDEPVRAVFSVYAPDVDVVYDGRAHSIAVLNTLEGDVVTYFDDSTLEWVDAPPAFIYPNTYTVRFKVVRPLADGDDRYVGTATVTIRRAVLDGIWAEPAVFVYDGAPHNISVVGASPAAAITYSLDGENFSSDFGVTEIGEYTVFYRVAGEYGDYASSCLLTVLPDIRGRYLNAERGIVELYPGLAAIGGDELVLVYGVDGAGTIGDEPFSAADGTLIYGGKDYSRLDASDRVYRLELNGNTAYFAAADHASADIRFEQNKAIFSVNGADISEAESVNYCDTTGEHKNFTVDLESSGAETVVALEFSLLPEQNIEPIEMSAVYDGAAHELDFEFDGRVRYETDGEYSDSRPSFTDIGTHTVGVLYQRDGFLPLESVATLYILPNIYGIYYSDRAVAVVASTGTTINGVAATLTSNKTEWAIDGKPITIEPDGIVAGGEKFKKRVDERFLLVVTPTATTVVRHSERDLTFEATAAGDKISFKICGHDGGALYVSEYDCASLTLSIDGQNRFTATAETAGSGVLGSTEINSSPVIKLDLTLD